MEDEFAELHLKYKPQADQGVAAEWFKRRGFTVTKTQTGLLLLGTAAQIEDTFSVSPAKVTRPADLPIPPAMKQHIASVILPAPHSYQ